MRYPGARQGPLPRPACLIGLLANLNLIANAETYDSPDIVQKSFDIIAVDVDIIDILSIVDGRTDKLPLTAAPLFDRKLLARKASTCPSDFSLCPASLSGGCCPAGFACDVTDCIQTSVASQTTALACGKAGFSACGVADGGGCCPSGYTCGRQNCTPPPSASAASQSCPASYYLCPASLDFGCCATSMGCALSGCYSTSPTTVVVTRTFTTASNKVTTITSTTVETPSAPTETAATAGSTTGIAYVAKLVPTTTAKTSAVAVADSGGLSGGAIGGIVGGVVALLVVVAVAAFCIIKVRRATKQIDEKRMSGSTASKTKTLDKPATGSGSGSASKPRASLHHPTPSVINHMEVDELLEGAETSSSGIGHSFINQAQNQASVTSTPAQPSIGTSYFDIPQRTHNRPGHYPHGSDPRISMDSPPVGSVSGAQSPSPINTPAVGSPHQPAELDGAFVAELPVVFSENTRPRPFSNISAVSGLSYAGFSPNLPQQQQPLMADYGHQRTWSDSSASTTGANTPLSPPPPQIQSTTPANPQLDVVVEELHGHYGPDHEVAGQTRT